MRICFIVGAFPKMKCGIGDYTYKLAEELSKNNIDVHVITSIKAENAKNTKFKVYNEIESWDKNGTKKILERLRKIKPDIVNIQYPSDEYKNNFAMNILPNKIKKEIKCKITATIHEYECFTLKRKIRFYLNFKNLDRIITVEDEFVRKIKKDFKKANVKYIKISSNIPRSKITKEEKETLKQKYNLGDSKVISFFGFANPSKGIEYLLRAVSKLENVKLLFINKLDENNEYHMSLLNLIKELDIEDRVIITGFLEEEDVANLISISDLAVLPFTDGVKSRNGSFLATYNQNIPVVTTAFDKKEEEGIYYVVPKNEEKLLEKIKQVLNEEKEFDREELTWKVVCKEYIEIFEEVMKNDGENNKK